MHAPGPLLSRPLRRAFSLLELITVIVILGVLAALAIPTFSAIIERSRQAQGVVTPARETVPVTASEPVDLSWLWTTLGVLGVLAVLVVVGVVVTSLVLRSRHAAGERRAALDARVARAEALDSRRAELESLYGAYLLDLGETLKRPLLSDVTVPQTAAFVEAHAALSSLGEVVGSDEDSLVTAERLISGAWSAWRTADAHARKVGLGMMSTTDRRKVKQAQALLAIAGDEAASEFERGVALEQVKKLLEGVVVLPARAMAVLESRVRPAIAA